MNVPVANRPLPGAQTLPNGLLQQGRPIFPPYVGALEGIGGWIATIFTLPTFCAAFDFYLSSLGFTKMMGILALIICLLTGAFKVFTNNGAGRVYLFLTFWFIAAVPFAVWRGGSIILLQQYWVIALACFVAVAGLLVSFQQVRRALLLYAWGVVITSVMIYKYGTIDPQVGRIILDNTRFTDSNDIGMVCIASLPLIAFHMRTPKLNGFWKFACLMGLLVVLGAFSKTGSRGGFLALIGLGLYLFWRGSFINKVKLAAVTVMIVLASAAFLPPELRQRYITFKTEDTGDPDDMNAGASSESRMHLFWESVDVTLRNPIFGVGPGNFMIEENNRAKGAGYIRGMWHATHNTYTEISSEAGIPALIAYVWLLCWCWTTLSKLEKPENSRWHPEAAQIPSMAFALKACLLTIMVSSTFLSITYHTKMPTLVGLVVAFTLAVSRENEHYRREYAARGSLAA
jgi:O-antigen ligase